MGSPVFARTFYQPEGDVVTQTSGGGLGPGAMPGGLPGMGFAQQLLAQRAAQAQREAAMRERMQRAQLAAMQQDMRMQREAGRASRLQPQAGANGDPIAMQQMQLIAMSKANRGTPIYTKAVGGPGMIAGNIRLNQWEPGAAFAGYSHGGGPASASFADTPGPSAAGLGASRREDLMERQGRAMSTPFEGPGYKQSLIPRLY